ncbi:formate/nitrite transporter family protein [Halobacterium zhouii]|uniref:formate/nitrite transporter family protein n=1 Tax=Halobacterium zhouii TaxID=2902624 RepID=UPI001E5C2332|nr:formate/nitrite transporter family protein [Halobacterium zhouii]
MTTDGGEGADDSESTSGRDSPESTPPDEDQTQSTEPYEDRAEKSYREILAQELERGVLELNRPRAGIFLSGLSAGLDIGFGPLLMAAILATPTTGLSPVLLDLITSSAYAVGFIFVVVGQSDLFTEHTTLAIIPVLDGSASWSELLRVWGLIYSSNLIGATAFAALAVLLGPAYDVVTADAFTTLATPLLEFSWWATLLAATLAGWLMGLLTWLVSASRSTISALVSVWLVALVIGYMHLPHSIAGTVEVLFGLFGGRGVSVLDFGRFLLLSTVGNIVGGTVFVGLLKYGHATQGGREQGGDTDNPETQS